MEISVVDGRSPPKKDVLGDDDVYLCVDQLREQVTPQALI
jgi:hypothetical protein